MGCPSRASSQLPIASAAVRLAPKKKVQKTPDRRLEIRDFHCPTCGLTKANYPNYFHRCPGEPEQPIAYQAARQAVCNECAHNRDGVCLPLKTKHPDYPGVIEVGVKMPGAQCPLRRWLRVLFACSRCGSVRFDPRGMLRCPVCRQGR